MMMKRLWLVLAIVLAIGVGAVFAQATQPAVTTPAGPLWAAWQPFQGGVMIWWSDTRQIWVLFNSGPAVHNGPAVVYPDLWSEGGASPPPSSCLITPVRGFGNVWRMLGGPASALGCPMAPEIGYDTAARIASGAETVIDGPGETLYGVTLPSGSSVGTWRIIRIH
jgi:hypothetical protein